MEDSAAIIANDDSVTVDDREMMDAVFLYLKESCYPSGSSDVIKRAIRRKAAMCFLRDGVLYIQKKKKKDRVLELRFVRTREDQPKILAACHSDPTAGHMGEKRTIARITERYTYSDM